MLLLTQRNLAVVHRSTYNRKRPCLCCQIVSRSWGQAKALSGVNPLFAAVQLGFASIVSFLVQDEVIEADYKEIPPLYMAAQGGCNAIVKMLLEAGASVHRTSIGASPLHVASELGHSAVVSSLLQAGASDRACLLWSLHCI